MAGRFRMVGQKSGEKRGRGTQRVVTGNVSFGSMTTFPGESEL
jgi:hypothetical protein